MPLVRRLLLKGTRATVFLGSVVAAGMLLTGGPFLGLWLGEEFTVSAEYETGKGLLGSRRKTLQSYRLDVPVFNDSKLLGIISAEECNWVAIAIGSTDTVATSVIEAVFLDFFRDEPVILWDMCIGITISHGSEGANGVVRDSHRFLKRVFAHI